MLIDSAEALSDIIDRALKVECVALDTEFVWERTYYPKLGLVQIGLSEEECYLIDTPAIDDLSSLGRLLEDANVIKILHDAQQDLIIMNRVTGALPKNVFDTRCAAGFAGLSSTISLSDLLREVVGIKLPKTESRTDWLKRPLTDKQVSYAIDDIKYMHKLRSGLLERMEDSCREVWMNDEFNIYEEPERYLEKDPYTQYERIKGKRRMAGVDTTILRELAAWRETKARKVDRPRGHVVADDILVALCHIKPESTNKLKTVHGLNEGSIRKYGAPILSAVKKGISLHESMDKAPRDKYPRNGVLNAQTDFVLAYMKGKSIDSKVDLALVASRAEVIALLSDGTAADPKNHRLLRGWRLEFLGKELQSLLAGEYTLSLDPESGLPQLIPATK